MGGQYGVQGFPTIKIFVGKSKKPVDYNGARSADALVEEAMKQVRRVANSRMKGKKEGNKTNAKKPKTDKASGTKKGSAKRPVVTLTDSNFNEMVMNSNDLWVVEFYAPWCGHCKQLEPEFKAAAKELLGSGVQLGALDATVHQSVASEYGIKGFPTLKIFRPGSKSSNDATDYQGDRTSSSIVSSALEALEKAGGAVATTVEFTDQTTIMDHCAGQSICVIAVIPPLLDSGKLGRNNYILMLEDAAKSARGKPVRFGWLAGGANAEWETKLDLSFGYPAMVAVHFSKERFAVMRGSFSAKGIKRFLDGVFSGSERTMPYDSLPELKTTTPWDGEDAPFEEQEKYDNMLDDTEDDEDDDILAEILASSTPKDEL